MYVFCDKERRNLFFFILKQRLMFSVLHALHIKVFLCSRLQITDSRSPVMMTDQIFFSPDKPRFWPVKLINIIIIFLPYAGSRSLYGVVAQFLSAIFARFMSVYKYLLQYHCTAVSEDSKVRPISAYR